MTTNVTDISNSADVIDVRDVIARVEELESEVEAAEDSDGTDNEEREELAALTALLDDLEGNGGDENWRGSWYPITLVRDSYFEDFAQEEADSLGLISSEVKWPYTCIDWEQAARELQQDYSSVEYEGVTYWYR